MVTSTTAGNTLDTAQNFGSLRINQSVIATDSVSASAPDYYRFTLLGRSSVNLNLSQTGGSAQVALLDQSGNKLLDSTNSNGLGQLVNTNLNAGTYYIQVASLGGSTSNYSLNLTNQNNAGPDLLWRRTTGELSRWNMNSVTPAGNQSLGNVADGAWKLAGSGDFNGDGNGDLLWRNQMTGENSLWLVNGTTQKIVNLTPIADQTWQVGTVGDFNGDGNADILWRNQRTGENSIWTMNGTSIAGTTTVAAVSDFSWRLIGTGDFDNDGKADLVWRNSTTGVNSVWLMNGNALTKSLSIGQVTDTKWSLQAVGDFNRDGTADLVWCNSSTGEVSAWQLKYDSSGLSVDKALTMGHVTDTTWQLLNAPVRYDVPTRIDGAGTTLTKSFTVGTLTNTATYKHWVEGATNPNDYYQFTLASTEIVNLALGGMAANADLQLLSSTGTVLTTSANSGTQNENIRQILSAGTYYAKVSADPGNTTNYQLDLAIWKNTAPTVDLNGTAAGVNFNASFTQGRGAVAIVDAINLSVADPDNTSLASAKVQITNIQDGTSEVLGWNTTLAASYGITANYSAGTLTLTGAATLNQYQAVLRSLTYNNTASTPTTTSRLITVTVNDSYVDSPAATTTVAVGLNTVPTIGSLSKSGNEDSAITFAASDFTSQFSDADSSDTLTKVKITALPTNGTLLLGGVTVTLNQEINAAQLGSLTYQPNANYNGSDSFGWNGSDGVVYATSNSTVSLTINAVNDAPTFTKGTNQTVFAGKEAQTVNGWATGISVGPANEASQTLSSFTVTTDRPDLFSVLPSIDASGNLTYTPTTTLSSGGLATITVKLQDDGGTANGGVDTSTQTFTITVTPRSATVGGDVFLASDYIQLGVSDAGSLGTQSNVPLGFFTSGTTAKVVMRTDLDGWNTGAAPKAGDFSLPGMPEDRIVVGYRTVADGTPTSFNNARLRNDFQFPSTSTDTSSGGTLSATTSGTVNSALGFKQVISMGISDKEFATTVTLTNTTGDTLYDVRYMRNLDPDMDVDFNGTYDTLNDVLSNPGGGSTEARVRAIGPVSGVGIDFYANDSRARASSFGFTNKDPFATSAYSTPVDPNGARADEAISITVALGDLAAGQSASFTFYTAFAQF